MKDWQIKPVATAVALLFCTDTFAQQPSDGIPQLPEVKVTVDRLQMPRDESASTISVLKRNDFERLPVKDTFDALSLLPNVSVRRGQRVRRG